MASTAAVDVRRAQAADATTLAAVLALAFYGDPVFAWVIPDAARRRACLPAVFAAFTEVYLPHDETYIAAREVGAALWASAGSDPMTREQAEALDERLGEVLGADAERAAEVNELLAQHHPADACAYLQFVGVRPEYQGRGIGSRLLTAMLGRCDATGAPAYLEATSVSNRRLYQRHGFDVVDEIALPQGPPLWPMWREAGTTATA